MPLVAPAPIESERLLIRLVEAADLAALLEVNDDPQVNEYLPYPRWRTTADAEAWYARMQAIQASGTALQFAVIDKATQAAIGTCLLFRFDESSARAELGYVLGRAHWGRGLMREALTALIDTAFETLSLRRLEAEVNPDNAASTGLLERLGFTREGLLRERWVVDGVAHDVAPYGLLRDEWRRP